MSSEDSPSFTVELTEDGSAAVVIVRGDVDYSSMTAFRSKLNQAARRSSRVIVDLYGVTFLDSSSLRLIVTARNHRELGTFAVRGLTGPSLQKLRFTGVLEMLDVDPDWNES